MRLRIDTKADGRYRPGLTLKAVFRLRAPNGMDIMTTKTTASLKPANVEKKWIVIDAQDAVVNVEEQEED